jgi:site-specific DNA-methyltransferase (adenine-specific)
MRARAAAAPPPEGCPWQVITGDCLAELARVEAGSVRLAFGDSPYNEGINYGQGEKADRLPRSEYLAWCGRWMVAVARTLAADGSFWVLINCKHQAEFKLSLEAAGLHVRQCVVWYESFGVNCGRSFNRTHRHLFWATKSPARFVFNPEAVNRPSARQTDYEDKRADPEGKLWDDVWGIKPAIPRLTGTCKERIPDFPTQLPVALLRPIVLGASDPGDLVVDPFSGSATTGVVAVTNGRRYLGIEKFEKFADLSRKRLAAEASP